MRTRVYTNLEYPNGKGDLVLCISCQGDEPENTLVPCGWNTCPTCGEQGLLQGFDDVIKDVDVEEYIRTHEVRHCIAVHQEN